LANFKSSLKLHWNLNSGLGNRILTTAGFIAASGREESRKLLKKVKGAFNDAD
jgi:hypothetical protein